MSSSSSRSSSTWSVPRLAPLPEYSELPPDMSFLVTERARRFTTITLKEVRYPSGCPCHPKDEETVKLYERLGRAASPDGRPALYVRHSRPELTERSNSSDSTNTNESSRRSTRQALGSFFRRLSSTWQAGYQHSYHHVTHTSTQAALVCHFSTIIPSRSLTASKTFTICCHLNKSALRHILPKFEQHCNSFGFIHASTDYDCMITVRGSLQHGKLESLSLGSRIFIFIELYNSHTARFFIFPSLENLAETRSWPTNLHHASCTMHHHGCFPCILWFRKSQCVGILIRGCAANLSLSER